MLMREFTRSSVFVGWNGRSWVPSFFACGLCAVTRQESHSEPTENLQNLVSARYRDTRGVSSRARNDMITMSQQAE